MRENVVGDSVRTTVFQGSQPIAAPRMPSPSCWIVLLFRYRTSDTAKSAIALRKGRTGFFEIRLVKIRPEFWGDPEFGVTELP